MKKVVMFILLTCSMVARADCYIMGDSIAQGLAMNRKDCSSETQVGLNTKKALKYWGAKGVQVHDKVIISLGVNDGNINTAMNLKMIRDNIKASQVIWILPPTAEKSVVVKGVATSYGDFVLNINSQLGGDKIHPTGKGYVRIAQHIKAFQNTAPEFSSDGSTVASNFSNNSYARNGGE